MLPVYGLEEEFDEWRFGNREGLHAMFIAFADESEVFTERVPIVGVGGAIGSGKQWTRAATAWRKALKTEPTVQTFHTKEFETPEGRKYSGIYKDWDQARCQTFGGKLIEALCRNHLGCVSAATVNPTEYAEVLAERKKRIHPMVNAHYFCTIMLFEQHSAWLEKFFPDQKITYYFESGGPHELGFKAAYRGTVNKRGAEKYFHFNQEPAFVPKNSYLELQIADKLIYETTKQASHHFDSEPPDKHAMPHPETGAKIWKTRYGAVQWVLSGLDIDTRFYTKEMINGYLDKWEL